MKLKIVILAVILLVITGIFLIMNRSTAPGPKKPSNNLYNIDNQIFEDNDFYEEDIDLPWAEVISSSVMKKVEDAWVKIESGDQLLNGDIIKTNESGLANIYMPDGSVARLDHNSEIVISQVDYDIDSKSLKVQIKLIAGRVWSKIGELITSESYWEVETANAVASVRGTAFGVEYENDETIIIGWENEINVQSIDMYSGRKSVPVIVSANKVLRINESIAKATDSERDVLSSRLEELTLEIENLPWVQRSIKSDIVLFGDNANNTQDEDARSSLIDVQSDEGQNDSIELLDINSSDLNRLN